MTHSRNVSSLPAFLHVPGGAFAAIQPCSTGKGVEPASGCDLVLTWCLVVRRIRRREQARLMDFDDSVVFFSFPGCFLSGPTR